MGNRIRRRSKRLSGEARKSRRTQAISAILTIAIGSLLAFQAITAIARGDRIMGENYLGQPVGPGLQLIVCAVAIVVGIVLAWQSFRRKPKPERKEKVKSNAIYFRWPHDNIP
jgi:ABC-type nickel/cobalt efflux system permease component RcnA